MNAPDYAVHISARLRQRAEELDTANLDAQLLHEAADFIEAERIRINALQRLAKLQAA